MADLSTKNALLVIAPENFRDEEFAQPHAALKIAGVNVTIASLAKGPCVGSRGSVVHAQTSLEEASAKKWDVVVFVGGSGAQCYVGDFTAHILARQTATDGNIVAAICMAPSILAHAGLLDGVEATADSDFVGEIKKYGAIYNDNAVVVSKNTINGAPIITANGARASFAFGQAIVNELRGSYDPFADLLASIPPRPPLH